jgi:anti-sigma factor RsiW
MDWNCTTAEERLSDYLDGLLSPAEAASFSAHAAQCQDCTQMLAQVGGLVHRMQQLPLLETPPQLVTAILAATTGPRKEKQGWKRSFSWIPMLWQPRFTMGLATVAATLLIVFYTFGMTPSRVKKTGLSPTNVLRSANRQVHLTYARGAKFVNDLRVVYEIQSRLQPEPESSPSSVPAPAPEHNLQPSPNNPQEKSQTSPHPGHSQSRNGVMLAFLVNDAEMRGDPIYE